MRVTLGACIFASVAAQRPAEISLFTAIQNTVAREQAVDEEPELKNRSDQLRKQGDDGARPAEISLFTAIQNTVAREQAVDEQPAPKKRSGNFLQQRDDDADQEMDDDMDDDNDEDVASDDEREDEDSGDSADPLDGTDEADLGSDDPENEEHIDDHTGDEDPMDNDTSPDDLLDVAEADGVDKEESGITVGKDLDDEKLAGVVARMLDGKAGGSAKAKAAPEEVGDDELAAMAGRMLDGKATKVDEAKLLTHMMGGGDSVEAGDGMDGGDGHDPLRSRKSKSVNARSRERREAEHAGSIAAVAKELDHAEGTTTMSPALRKAHEDFARELGRIQPDGGDDSATHALAKGVAVDTLDTLRQKAAKPPAKAAAPTPTKGKTGATELHRDDAPEGVSHQHKAGAKHGAQLRRDEAAKEASHQHKAAMAKAAAEMPAHIAVPEDPHFEAALEAAVAMEAHKPRVAKAPAVATAEDKSQVAKAPEEQREEATDEPKVPAAPVPTAEAQEEAEVPDKDEDQDSNWDDQEGGHLTAFSQQ